MDDIVLNSMSGTDLTVTSTIKNIINDPNNKLTIQSSSQTMQKQ